MPSSRILHDPGGRKSANVYIYNSKTLTKKGDSE
jgi:hypothetical protein